MLTAKGFLTSKQVTHPLPESNGCISLSPLNLKAVKSLSRMAHTAMLVLEGVQSDFWSYLKKQLNLTFINWPAKLQSGNVTRPDQSHSFHQTPWPEIALHVHSSTNPSKIYYTWLWLWVAGRSSTALIVSSSSAERTIHTRVQLQKP